MKARGFWILALVMTLLSVRRASADDLSLDAWRNPDRQTVQQILALARGAFDGYILRREAPPLPTSLPPLLRQRVGVFVSAMRHGAPRCCMGTLYPTEPDAAHEILAAAMAAAGHDRRFPPIRPGERKGLILIVSIVGRPRPISPGALSTLDPTREGLVVKTGGRYGVVLSGETDRLDRMLAWGRIRAGAHPGDSVALFRIDVVRFVESQTK
ncbi:MAG TPA: AMMECR1 domain-containing protein [Chthonomonadaceae bacterium]|nr:AMMECR1 domain-containing protein [Chthonomonadaceae bacterium]